MSAPLLFDAALRSARFRHAAGCPADDRWLIDRMADELTERLASVTRPLPSILLIGQGTGRMAADPMLEKADCTIMAADEPDFTEERLALEPGRYDAILSCATLDTANDLPGVLALMRRTLKPGGLMLAACAGAGSLAHFKAALRSAEEDAGGPAVARFHPMIDVRAAGDLLGRAGFTMPVADGDEITVRYRSVMRLRRDIKGAAMGLMLADRHPLSRAAAFRLAENFAETFATDGGLMEQFALLYLTGWSPDT